MALILVTPVLWVGVNQLLPPAEELTASAIAQEVVKRLPAPTMSATPATPLPPRQIAPGERAPGSGQAPPTQQNLGRLPPGPASQEHALALIAQMKKAQLEESQTNGPRTYPSERGSHPSSPIEKLSELGWTVKPGAGDIQFEVMNRSLPDMKASADQLRQIRKPFHLHLQSVTGIAGLALLSGIHGCTRIEINAGEFSDLSDLASLGNIKSLLISQTPLSGFAILDLSPLSKLTQLQELGLFGSRVTDIRSLATLTKLKVLNLRETPIRDIGPLSGMTGLQILDIAGTEVRSLSPLVKMTELKRLDIDGKQVPDLRRLSGVGSLSSLTINYQDASDLSGLGELANLTDLFIWGSPRIDLMSLRHLGKLQQLTVSGRGIGPASIVTSADAIGNLKELTTLSLGSLDINNVSFLRGLDKLKQLHLGEMPVGSIEPLRGLTSLSVVSLNRIPVVDISPLLELPALVTLSVIGTPARADVLTELERRGVKVQR